MSRWGKISGLGFCLAVAAALLAFGDGSRPAYAQFVCDSDAAGEDGQGATATGSVDNSACGRDANASRVGGFNTATGALSNASGFDGFNTTSGADADASGDRSVNSASGFVADASGDDSSNTANGFLANASGEISENVAFGADAFAAGDDGAKTAIGARRRVLIPRLSARAPSPRATIRWPSAPRPNTYTMAGIGSNESRAAQQGPHAA